MGAKRHTILKIFLTKLLKEEDIAIFTGQNMCKEAYLYDRPGNFYLKDSFGSAVSIATGLAMGSKKRVFLFTGEGDLLREIGSGIQAGVSKCRNLFIVILNNKVYDSVGSLPNLFASMNSTRAMIASFGMFMHDYTPYFKERTYNQILGFFDDLTGPLSIFIDITPGFKKDLEEIKISDEEMTSRLIYFNKVDFEIQEDINNSVVLELNKKVEFGGNG